MAASLSNFNQFPIHEAGSTITLNLNSIRLTFLIVGLIQFFLVNIISARKRIFRCFSWFQPRLFTTRSSDHHQSHTLQPLIEKKSGDQSAVCRSDMEIVLRSLRMVSSGEDNRLPSRVDADELFNMFEERNPSLDEVKAAFDVFDGNSDGFIDAKDLQKVLCGLGLKEGSDMESCRRMIGAFDEDGEGRMGFEEFVTFMENSFN